MRDNLKNSTTEKANIWLVLLVMTVASCVVVAGCSSPGKLPGWMALNPTQGEAGVTIPWQSSFDVAKKLAGDDKVIMLLFTGTDWCKPCTVLKKEVFETRAFQAWSSDRVVPVMLDFPKPSSTPTDHTSEKDALRVKYGVDSYPTAVFVNQNGEVLGKLGYIEGGAENWIGQAESALSMTW